MELSERMLKCVGYGLKPQQLAYFLTRCHYWGLDGCQIDQDSAVGELLRGLKNWRFGPGLPQSAPTGYQLLDDEFLDLHFHNKASC
jgi:hypothetical protein